MEWIVSIGGGLVAGLIVLLFDVSYIVIRNKCRRRRVFSYLRGFVDDWQSKITDAQGIEERNISANQVRFMLHESSLYSFRNTVQVYSSRFKPEQVAEVIGLIDAHLVLVSFAKNNNKFFGDMKPYDEFFEQLRSLRWLWRVHRKQLPQ